MPETHYVNHMRVLRKCMSLNMCEHAVICDWIRYSIYGNIQIYGNIWQGLENACVRTCLYTLTCGHEQIILVWMCTYRPTYGHALKLPACEYVHTGWPMTELENECMCVWTSEHIHIYDRARKYSYMWPCTYSLSITSKEIHVFLKLHI